MLRECRLEDISDGRTYGPNDMVKADTGSCVGCHKCCTGMGSSIVLDPFDIFNMKLELGKSFEELLGLGFIELNMVDGLILPNLKMNEKNECSFLNEEGRCSIHNARPGICRLFPLGRIYDKTTFKFFLQKGECAKNNLTKIKVRKWIDVSDIEANTRFINSWHYFIRSIGDKNIYLRDNGMGDKINEIAMYVLNEFFVKDIEVSHCNENEPERDNDIHSNILQEDEIYSTLCSKIENAKDVLKFNK